LGRQSQAWQSSGLTKASALPKSRWASSPPGRLQCQQTHHPTGGVWRREREAGAGKLGGVILQALALRTVESTQVFRSASAFAGWRVKVGLGWSVCVGAGFLPVRRHAPATRGARRLPRRGTSSASRHAHATQHGAPYATALGDASFARSFDPRTSTATSNLRSQKLRKVAHHGNASPSQSRARARGKTAKGRPGWDAHGSQLGHRLPLEGGHCVIKRNGRGLRPPSCEDPKLGVVLVRRNAVAEVVVATPGLK